MPESFQSKTVKRPITQLADSPNKTHELCIHTLLAEPFFRLLDFGVREKDSA